MSRQVGGAVTGTATSAEYLPGPRVEPAPMAADPAGGHVTSPFPAAGTEPGPDHAFVPPGRANGRPGWRSRLRRLLPLVPLLPLAAAVWWVQTFNPTDNTPDPTGPCLWHALTGINGPTCGGTRAFTYLIHGNLVEAARFHLPFVLAVPFVSYWWLSWLAQATFGIRLPRLRPRPWMLATYGVFFLVFTTMLRNLPFAPFHWFDIPNLTHRMT
jgi:Protein of unknown function (DUF2752)